MKEEDAEFVEEVFEKMEQLEPAGEMEEEDCSTA
jgi:hypothetical protein